jgi:exo-beta-1,3-glucanase (GH17 family)
MSKDLSNILFGANYAWAHYGVVAQNNNVPPSFVDTDLALLTKNFNAIRIYSVDKWYTPIVLNAATRYQLDVVVEMAWVYGSDAANKAQYDTFKYVMGKYPEMQSCVKFVFIGHEDMPATVDHSNDLLEQVTAVQTWINSHWTAAAKPVVTLDEQNGVWNGTSGTPGYNCLHNLAADVPIFTNIYPYWADLNETDGTTASNQESFQAKWGRVETSATAVSRDIYIGETGWPSAGPGSTLAGHPTKAGNETEAKNYWNFLFDWVQNSSPSNFKGVLCFMSFDEPFKGGTPDTFDHHWGIYNKDRTLKPGINLPFSRTITPSGATGTPVNIIRITTSAIQASWVTVNVYPKGSSTPIAFPYPEWSANDGDKIGYPFVQHGGDVEVVVNGGSYTNAKVRYTLNSGDGIGEASQINLVWTEVSNPDNLPLTFSNTGVWM